MVRRGLSQIAQFVGVPGDQCDAEWSFGLAGVGFPPLFSEIVDPTGSLGPRVRRTLPVRGLDEFSQALHKILILGPFDNEEPFTQRETVTQGRSALRPGLGRRRRGRWFSFVLLQNDVGERTTARDRADADPAWPLDTITDPGCRLCPGSRPQRQDVLVQGQGRSKDRQEAGCSSGVPDPVLRAAKHSVASECPRNCGPLRSVF